MATAKSPYSKLDEEPLQEVTSNQDEPVTDAPESEELLSHDRPYPSLHCHFPKHDNLPIRDTPESAFPAQTFTVSTSASSSSDVRMKALMCGYVILLIYSVVALLFCLPFGLLGLIFAISVRHEYKERRHTNSTVLVVLAIVFSTLSYVAAVVLSIIIFPYLPDIAPYLAQVPGV